MKKNRKLRKVERWSQQLYVFSEGWDKDFDYKSPELTWRELHNILKTMNIRALVRAELKKRPKDTVIEWNYI